MYKIVNSINDKVYIGITSRPKTRFKEHCYKNSNCTKLRRAMNKHGVDKFRMEVLCIGTEEYIIDIEEKAIKIYDSIVNGYNTLPGNPKTGGLTLPEDVKFKISDSLNTYHANNIAWNKGIFKESLPSDIPHYAMGFWFPSPRHAVRALGIKASTFYKWRAENTLGEEIHLSKDNVVDNFCYVGGMWFPNLRVASEMLEVNLSALKKRIRTSAIEENLKPKGVSGEANHMTGKTGALHHNSKSVLVDGVIYGSISEASRQTEYSKKMIYSRIKNKVTGFELVGGQ